MLITKTINRTFVRSNIPAIGWRWQKEKGAAKKGYGKNIVAYGVISGNTLCCCTTSARARIVSAQKSLVILQIANLLASISNTALPNLSYWACVATTWYPARTMGSTPPTQLPYWQINVPEHLRSAECPAFLAHLTPKDQGIISTPDASYRLIRWPEVQRIIADNRIDHFQRVPSELRRYLAYNWSLKQQYGSVMEFMLQKRLGWSVPVVSEGGPFEREADVKILWNDWPYGIDERIVHLVVWTKFELEDDPETDDLTAQARREIDEYVDRVFGERVGKENVGLAVPDGGEIFLLKGRIGHLVQELEELEELSCC